MAKALQAIYPQARVSIHGEFQTAALLWHEDRTLGNLWMDIATARTEFYPYPAANPEVEASSIRQDLYRRDFSINALALRLTAPHAGELLDFFGGLEDLKARTLRVLHANSFIEDPTRIYRGVRFAVRLGFEFDDQTLGYIRYALESGVYEQLKLSDNPAPALTTRLRAELKYILESNYWRGSLKLLAQLTALRCLDPDLRLTDRVWWQIRYGDRWLHHLGLKSSVEPWLLRLELLLADLSTAPIIASNLQLPKDSIHRLTILAPAIATLVEQLTPAQQPSEIYRVLITYKLPLLLLIAPKLAPSLRRKLWLYLTRLQFTKTCLNGSDLKAMGYKPGPQFKAILDDLLWATLDQCINNREDAIEWVNSYSGE
jgi:tRNA nucleotidyltransferase (CCA-adding enzyme)